MTKEQKFYNALKNIFVGAKVEGESGYINLMKIKSRYYEKGVFPKLQKDIDKALKPFPDFREELFEKLYTFFHRYFSESGSIYFRYTPLHQNIYEKVYTDDRDVMLFWKTHMLYYVKTDRLFKNLEVEIDNFKFFFDVSQLEHKKAFEKKSVIYDFREKKKNGTLIFDVSYTERGKKTKITEILKALKHVLSKSEGEEGVTINEDVLERAFRIFEKQSEVDYFINKNAKEFLREQFNIWLYQYVFSGESEWTEERIKQLQILKDIAFKIIDFISQFEDELVKIWNKPKFVVNSNYVITLDRVLKNSPSLKGWQAKPDGVVHWKDLPYNPKLREKAKELRKAGNLAEVLFWKSVKNKQFLGLDFDRQKIIGNYIVDFYCKDLGFVVEIDGESHDFKGNYDEERDKYLKTFGLEVFHFKDKDIKENLDGIIKYLKQGIKNTPSLRDTPLKEGNLIEKIINHNGIDKQVKEWQDLGIVDKDFNSKDVIANEVKQSQTLNKKYQHLPIDTKYFKDLEIEILGLFDNLDESLDGWLIKSENYQALNTILLKFKERIKCIYIDPPYNTGYDEFLYKDNYQHSSWLAMVENRLNLAKEIMEKKGIIFVSIGDEEITDLTALMDGIFFVENRISLISRIMKTASDKGNFFAPTIDYILNYAKNIKETISYKDEVDINLYPKIDKNGRKYRDDVALYQARLEIRPHQRYYIKCPDGSKVIPPKGGVWRWTEETFYKNLKEGKIVFKPTKKSPLLDENGNPAKWNIYTISYYDERQERGTRPRNLITEFINRKGADLLKKMGLEYDYSKPVELIHYLLKITRTTPDDIIMDFFAGSGTTAHAIMKLNKDDGRYRKFILVEMADYFNTIIIPRIKKVAYSFNWKDGKPQDADGIGTFFKYYELEQYEDTLRKVKYEDSDLFENPYEDPYNQYVFMKDLKMLKALEIDSKNNKVKVDLSKLYPLPNSPLSKGGTKGGIDIPETLSNLLGKRIKTITADEVEFEDGEKIDINDLDYNIIKPLIWW